jgi:hypothetical protein
MGDFEIGCLGGTKRNGYGSGKHSRHHTDFHEFSSLTETLPEKLRAIDLSAQPPARKIFCERHYYSL